MVRHAVLFLVLAVVVSATEASPPQSVPAALPTPSVVAGLPPAQRVGNKFRNLDPEYHRASLWVRARSLIIGGTWLVGERRAAARPTLAPDVPPLHHTSGRPPVTCIGPSPVLG